MKQRDLQLSIITLNENNNLKIACLISCVLKHGTLDIVLVCDYNFVCVVNVFVSMYSGLQFFALHIYFLRPSLTPVTIPEAHHLGQVAWPMNCRVILFPFSPQLPQTPLRLPALFLCQNRGFCCCSCYYGSLTEFQVRF